MPRLPYRPFPEVTCDDDGGTGPRGHETEDIGAYERFRSFDDAGKGSLFGRAIDIKTKPRPGFYSRTGLVDYSSYLLPLGFSFCASCASLICFPSFNALRTAVPPRDRRPAVCLLIASSSDVVGPGVGCVCGCGGMSGRCFVPGSSAG